MATALRLAGGTDEAWRAHHGLEGKDLHSPEQNLFDCHLREPVVVAKAAFLIVQLVGDRRRSEEVDVSHDPGQATSEPMDQRLRSALHEARHAEHQHPARRQDPPHFARALPEERVVLQGRIRNDDVESAVLERYVVGVRLDDLHAIEFRRKQIEADPVLALQKGKVEEGRCVGRRTDLEHALARSVCTQPLESAINGGVHGSTRARPDVGLRARCCITTRLRSTLPGPALTPGRRGDACLGGAGALG